MKMLILSFTSLTLLAACGIKGDLVRPSDIKKAEQEKAEKAKR